MGGISSRQRFEEIQTHRAAYQTFELIAPIENLPTSWSGLRKCGLSTDVDKAVSNSTSITVLAVPNRRGRASPRRRAGLAVDTL